MEEINEEVLKAKARKFSIIEGCGYSFMDGFGLKFITPYAVALGANSIFMGFLNSMPGLLGNFSQLYGAKFLEKYSRKKIVLVSVFLQALMWLPLILAGLLYFRGVIGSFHASLLLLSFYSLMIVAGSFGGPAWTSMMRDIVSSNSGSYFGRRNAIVGFFSLIAMLMAGFLLDKIGSHNLMLGFVVLLFVAFLGRSFSGFMFSITYEPKFVYDKKSHFTFLQFIRKMPYNNFGRFVLFSGLMSLAVNIGSPFFGVFMLKNLGFEHYYIAYTLISMSSVIANLLTMKKWGRFIDKYGNVNVFRTMGLLIPIVPIYWIASYWISGISLVLVVVYLIVMEAFSGFIWAGFNLASSLFIYDAVSKERLAICVAYDNIIGAIGSFLGAMLGGLLLSYFPDGAMALLIVFGISFFARLAIALFMAGSFKEVRKVEEFNVKEHVRNQLRKVDPRYLFSAGIKRFGLIITPEANS